MYVRAYYVAVSPLSWLFTRVMCVSLTQRCVLHINNPVLRRLSYTHMHTVRVPHHLAGFGVWLSALLCRAGPGRAGLGWAGLDWAGLGSVRHTVPLSYLYLQRQDPLWGSHRLRFGAYRGLVQTGQRARVMKLAPSTGVKI
jgi:hypothetical protein